VFRDRRAAPAPLFSQYINPLNVLVVETGKIVNDFPKYLVYNFLRFTALVKNPVDRLMTAVDDRSCQQFFTRSSTRY
jgi:hypothetical protein